MFEVSILSLLHDYKFIMHDKFINYYEVNELIIDFCTGNETTIDDLKPYLNEFKIIVVAK